MILKAFFFVSRLDLRGTFVLERVFACGRSDTLEVATFRPQINSGDYNKHVHFYEEW